MRKTNDHNENPEVHSPKPLVHVSLCAGYGGIDLGLALLGINSERSIYVEIETFAVQNLVTKIEEGFLPPGPVFQDLKQFPFEELAGPRDFDLVLSGGFPCTPFSTAGLGRADEDPRHLFPFILEGIRACRPGLVVLENVDAVLSAKLKGDHWRDPAGTPVALHVLRELERIGYSATLRLVSASEVLGTDGDGRPRCIPHQRKRVFFVAVADSGRERGEAGVSGPDTWEERLAGIFDYSGGERPRAVARSGEPQHDWEAPRVV